MPTSTAAPSTDRDRSRLRGSAGFTLIDLGLVLIIIGIVITLVVPHFTDQSRAALASQTRKLAAVVRFLQDEAVLNGRVYQLNFDLDQQRYFVTSADGDTDLGGGFQRESGILAHDTVLPTNVQIADVNVPMVGGKLSEGVAFAHFYPDGTVDQMVVHLDNGQEAFTLYVPDGFTGHAYVASGYLDVAAHG
jgi:general secretion pathway protein H